jgi:hypothetical protein
MTQNMQNKNVKGGMGDAIDDDDDDDDEWIQIC